MILRYKNLNQYNQKLQINQGPFLDIYIPEHIRPFLIALI